MINSFLSYRNSWDFGALNVNLVTLSGVALAYRFQSRGRFLVPVKFYLLSQQLFQTKTLALASDCRRPRLQMGKLEPYR
jgi:hypothetical protein